MKIQQGKVVLMNKVCKKLRQDEISIMIRHILESNFFLPAVDTAVSYGRVDDSVGEKEGVIQIMFDPDGQAFVCIEQEASFLHFRMTKDGGKSPRVRAALLILAEAIRLDNADSPGEAR